MKQQDIKVTGVLVTGKTTARYPLALKAVQAWERQEYQGDRELLIINDNPTVPLYDKPEMVPEGVRELDVSGDPRKSLGALRNIGIEEATGDYLVQWDDDDYSHPARLAWQVQQTEAGKASVFRWEIHCNLLTGQAFVNSGQEIRGKGFPGTMLWPRSVKARFPELGKTEDMVFVLALRKEIGLQALHNDPRYYFRCYHGHNTWDEHHIMRHKVGARELVQEERSYIETLLAYEYADIRRQLRATTD